MPPAGGTKAPPTESKAAAPLPSKAVRFARGSTINEVADSLSKFSNWYYMTRDKGPSGR